jgi:DNA-binding NarL/FixJ family response regulator
VSATRRPTLLYAHHDRVTRVLVLTTCGLDSYVVEALRSGASGFLLKVALPSDLLTAIRVVADGDALLDPKVTRG